MCVLMSGHIIGWNILITTLLPPLVSIRTTDTLSPSDPWSLHLQRVFDVQEEVSPPVDTDCSLGHEHVPEENSTRGSTWGRGLNVVSYEGHLKSGDVVKWIVEEEWRINIKYSCI